MFIKWLFIHLFIDLLLFPEVLCLVLIKLRESIVIILDRVYNRKEISTVLKKDGMKKLLTMCTKKAHFILNNEIYLQNDGVAMDSPIGPILANVFMVELENTLILSLHQHVKKWTR